MEESPLRSSSFLFLGKRGFTKATSLCQNLSTFPQIVQSIISKATSFLFAGVAYIQSTRAMDWFYTPSYKLSLQHLIRISFHKQLEKNAEYPN